MAHSIQKFEDRRRSLDDSDLIVILGFAFEGLRVTSRFPHLKSMADEWRRSLGNYGPGVLNLKLPQYLENCAARNEFCELLDWVEAQVQQYSDKIPAVRLNELIEVPGIRFLDYHTDLLIKTLSDLRRLVRGT